MFDQFKAPLQNANLLSEVVTGNISTSVKAYVNPK